MEDMDANSASDSVQKIARSSKDPADLVGVKARGRAMIDQFRAALSTKLAAVAKTDAAALAMARDMVKGASAVARFDLWQAERRIEGEAPTAKEKPRR